MDGRCRATARRGLLSVGSGALHHPRKTSRLHRRHSCKTDFTYNGAHTCTGYTVFAGELNYANGDPECGYKVYIGPGQYFVITDIGRGRYQWYDLTLGLGLGQVPLGFGLKLGPGRRSSPPLLRAPKPAQVTMPKPAHGSTY